MRKKPKGPICPSCGKAAELLMNSAAVYGGRDFGPTWRCGPCDTRVGCHPGTTRPLGNLAGARLRRARAAAHAVFDPLWHAKVKRAVATPRAIMQKIARTDAYSWLSRELKIIRDRCHIGMMDEADCKRVFELCRPYAEKITGARFAWPLDASETASSSPPVETWQARAESAADERP